MVRLFLMLTLFLTSLTTNATSIDEMLGTVPGERSEFKGKSIGGPIEILRIPTIFKKLKEVYPDLEVMISRDNRKVVGVGSKRAYSTSGECKQAKFQVISLLKQTFPNAYTGKDPRWQYQSLDGSITAGAICSGSHPFPVLRLDVTHTATNNEILRHFK